MYTIDILKTNFIHENCPGNPDFIDFHSITSPESLIFTGMKHLFGLLFLVFIAFSTPACSKKSGCPADSAQSKVDKDGQYKSSKTKSGLLPPKKNYKFKRYKPKHKEKHPI